MYVCACVHACVRACMYVCMSTFSTPLKPLGRLKPNFMWSLYGTGKRKLFKSYSGPGHMTKMAAMPICGKKNLKNRLLRNQKADDLETWYAALDARVLPSLFK